MAVENSPLGNPIAKGIVVMLFVGAILAYAFWPRHLPPPEESNRVRHPAGYSVIAPPSWKSRYEALSRSNDHKDILFIEPSVDTKWAPGLMITRLRFPPDKSKLSQEGFTEGTFQKQPALLNYYEIDHYWIWRAYVERAGEWFELRLQINNYQPLPGGDWWDYLNSFVFEPPPATRPLQ